MQKQVNVTDVTIKKLNIKSAIADFDLRPFMVELTIEENIFKTSLTGTMVLAESYNLPEKFPIVGEEVLDIDISLTGLDGKSNETHYTVNPPPMHINTISSRWFSAPKAQVFTVEFISEQYMSSIHSKVSRSYNNKTISNIVSDIYYDYLYNDNDRELLVESTDRIENIIIPNMEPLEAIVWLSKRAMQKDNAGINYLFYETLDGSNFVSLNKLSEKLPFFTLVQKIRTNDASGVETLSAGEQRINDLHFMSHFDKANNAITGLYASKLITHDILRKKITQYDFNGFHEFVKLNHVGTYPVISSSDVDVKSASVPRTTFAPPDEDNNFPVTTERDLSSMTDSRVIFYPKHDKMYSKNRNDLYDNKAEEWRLQRIAQMKAYDNIVLIVDIAGNSTLRVGQTITIEIPSAEATDSDKSSDNYYDKNLSGTYLITVIKHKFHNITSKDNKINYTMSMEVVKDAFEDVVANRTSRKEK
jgi:hypothetical protein